LIFVNFLEKIRKQPENTKKLILWLIVIIIGIVLLFWWLRSIYYKISNFPKGEFIEQLNVPSFEEEMNNFSLPELPEIGEEMEKIEEEYMKEYGEEIENIEGSGGENTQTQ